MRTDYFNFIKPKNFFEASETYGTRRETFRDLIGCKTEALSHSQSSPGEKTEAKNLIIENVSFATTNIIQNETDRSAGNNYSFNPSTGLQALPQLSHANAKPRLNLSLEELQLKAGDDWSLLKDNPIMLVAFDYVTYINKLIRSGVVPKDYTSKTYCQSCGEVPIHPEMVGEGGVLACPWCFVGGFACSYQQKNKEN